MFSGLQNGTEESKTYVSVLSNARWPGYRIPRAGSHCLSTLRTQYQLPSHVCWTNQDVADSLNDHSDIQYCASSFSKPGFSEADSGNTVL